jgi:hypothetical protein
MTEMSLQIGLLGPFRVCVDGERVDVPPRRLRDLLATLALSAGQSVSVDGLATVQSTNQPTAQLSAERLPEMGAVELIAPIALRKELIIQGEFERLGVDGMIERFQLPGLSISLAFNKTYIEIADAILA